MARPVGTTGRVHFHTLTTEQDRKEYVKWVLKVYKQKNRGDLAKWVGDQMFGKAVQPLSDADGQSLAIAFHAVFNSTSEAGGDHKK